MMRKNLVELFTSSLFRLVRASAKRSSSRILVRESCGNCFFSCPSTTSVYKSSTGRAKLRATIRLPSAPSTSVATMATVSILRTLLANSNSTRLLTVPISIQRSFAKGALRLYREMGSITA